LEDFPYSAEEQRREVVIQAGKMSIQGVQPKLSVRLNVRKNIFNVVDSGGDYIIKPQLFDYAEVPENEDLTMRLAAIIGLEVPLHGLMYSIDGSFAYFIRRFDRIGRGGKLPLEDFAQLTGNDRDTKYRSSMEQVAAVIERFCTFPAIEKTKLFKLTLFNFLIGNEDSHLKNYSLIRRDSKIELSPLYDLLNSAMILKSKEEIALPLNGKKRNLDREDFLDYFARERLGLTEIIIKKTLSGLENAFPIWIDYIQKSFLSEFVKKKYIHILKSRVTSLDLKVELFSTK
jgi:serine/threonine-protein kinase HipA